ncbi:MAG TPA: ATP-binding protein [Candidatus Polarisedimenticolia bacterium]|nr:ATP-binding protein [Candidatus Polarisedimenticolia bacterium]
MEPAGASLLADREGIVRMVSSSAAAMLGRAASELEGRRLDELLQSPGRAVVEAILRSLADPAYPQPARLAARLAGPGGSALDADLWLRASAGDGPADGAILITIEPVAARPAGTGTAAVGEPAAGGVLHDAVLICRGGTIVEAGEGMAELAGLDPARLAGWRIRSLVAAEDLLPVVQILRGVEAGEPSRVQFGFRLLRHDAPPVEVAARARRITVSGRPAVLLGLQDISGSLRAARAAADRLLQLDAALAAAHDAVLLIGLPEAGSPVMLASPALKELFGVEPSRWLGRSFWDLWRAIRPAHTFPDDDERVLRGLLEDASSMRVDTLLVSRPSRRVVERFFGPMRSPDGTLLGRVCAFRDVTQRAEAEAEMRAAADEARRARRELEELHEELRLANEGLERRMAELHRLNKDLKALDEMKSNLLANVSHELQTPLVSIKGFTEMILKGRLGGVTPEQERGLQVALRNVNRLIALIDNLLSFARSESSFPALKLEIFPLGPLVAEALELLAEKAAARGISLRSSLPPGDLAIRADRDKILQVLLNLVTNAVKYNRDGGEVVVTAEGRRGAARVEVRDTGVGIGREDLERIFERHYQADNAPGPREGAGIGLAIAKNLLRLHGCMIRADSELGKGSVFSFTLPLDRKGRAEKTAPRFGHAPAEPAEAAPPEAVRSHHPAGGTPQGGEPGREES